MTKFARYLPRTNGAMSKSKVKQLKRRPMNLLPKAVFEQHIIALGKTGAGKSSAIRGIVETLLDQGKRVIVVTPKADWYGIKLSADGKNAGYPIPVFGGQHQDLPLNHLSGKTMAELLGTGDRSAI